MHREKVYKLKKMNVNNTSAIFKTIYQNGS